MGNTVTSDDFEKRQLGEAHLDASSPKVIDSRCVTHNDNMKLVLKGGKSWYYLSKHDNRNEEIFVFGIQKQRQFAGSATRVIVDNHKQTGGATTTTIAVLQTTQTGKGIKTLIYRPTETFENQQPTMELYSEKERKKAEKNKQELPKLFLFSRVQSSAASKCDANYALL